MESRNTAHSRTRIPQRCAAETIALHLRALLHARARVQIAGTSSVASIEEEVMKWNVLAPALGLSVAVLAAAAFVAGGAATSPAFAQGARGAPASPTWAPGGKRERLTADNCVFAFIDHQTGLMNLVESATAVTFKNIVLGLAETAKLHGVPVVITTSAETGPNGPFLPEVLRMFPDAPLISRPGQINAWDNADFVAAIERTGRKKIVMSGITTDVCVAFAALSALDAGYEVYVVVDASGSMNEDVQDAALMRMSDAGAIIGTWFAISCELLSDWRNAAGPGTAKLFIDRMPSYAEVFHSHEAQSKPTSGDK
jgi:nicotinamidase-related amidase